MGIGVGVVATWASCSVASSERGKAQQASRWLLTWLGIGVRGRVKG